VPCLPLTRATPGLGDLRTFGQSVELGGLPRGWVATKCSPLDSQSGGPAACISPQPPLGAHPAEAAELQLAASPQGWLHQGRGSLGAKGQASTEGLLPRDHGPGQSPPLFRVPASGLFGVGKCQWGMSLPSLPSLAKPFWLFVTVARDTGEGLQPGAKHSLCFLAPGLSLGLPYPWP
jgi:hypothetical protein